MENLLDSSKEESRTNIGFDLSEVLDKVKRPAMQVTYIDAGECVEVLLAAIQAEQACSRRWRGGS
jgi:hypothetical protein